MHLQLLGTAAAEGWPAIFCGCETCSKARASGGKDLRSRASLQIDGVHKIDLPPDTYYHSVLHGLKFSQLESLFFTHSHEDHFALREICYLKPPFAHNLRHAPLKIYGNRAVLDAIDSRYGGADLPIDLIEARAYQPVQSGQLVFTPIKAQHAPSEDALNYVVQSPQSTVLYASDTGFYDEPTIARLFNYRFDLMIVECTQGTLDSSPRFHMGFEAVLRLRDRLDRGGAVKTGARTVITHFSHNIGMMHHELESLANPEAIEVAYDGIAFDV